MDKSDFDALIRNEQEAAAREPAFDPQAQKDEWLTFLNHLYTTIRSFLNEYVDAGQVQISTKTIQIDEEQTGPYDAPQLLIAIGRQVVRTVPIGTFIIGAKGRVDVVGPSGDARLILTDKRVTHPSQLIRVTVHLVGKRRKPRKPRLSRPQRRLNGPGRSSARRPNSIFRN